MQFQKKKINQLGAGGAPATQHDEARYSLDKMNLDRKDNG